MPHPQEVMPMSRTVRVLIANERKLTREVLLSTLAEHDWVQVVGEVPEITQIREHVERTCPDLLVIDAADERGKRPGICDPLLREHPELRILAVAPNENYTVCYWASFDIHSDDVEPSEEGFLTAVRSVGEISGKTTPLN